MDFRKEDRTIVQGCQKRRPYNRTNPLSNISWTSTMRCSVVTTQQTKKTFSTVPTVPTTRTRTRTQMDELDWGEVGGWMWRSELCVREKPVCGGVSCVWERNQSKSLYSTQVLKLSLESWETLYATIFTNMFQEPGIWNLIFFHFEEIHICT